jgi:hypothetical protein
VIELKGEVEMYVALLPGGNRSMRGARAKVGYYRPFLRAQIGAQLLVWRSSHR